MTIFSVEQTSSANSLTAKDIPDERLRRAIWCMDRGEFRGKLHVDITAVLQIHLAAGVLDDPPPRFWSGTKKIAMAGAA